MRRYFLLSATTLLVSMLLGVNAYAADVDKTDKVGTSKEAWNATGGPVTIDGISMPEMYEQTTATLGDVMWQTVEGLDNGTYTVELWANARYTAGRGFESSAADGALDCTFLFANNVEITIPVIYNSDLNNNTSHVLEGVEVTDGTLKMGMTKKADGSNWHTIQIKSLTLHVTLADTKEVLKATIDAAAAVPATEALTAAIAVAQDVYDTSADEEEVNAAIETLKTAIVLAENTNAVAGATTANPVATDFVINGTFDANGVVTPWKTTTGAQNQTTATNQQGAFTGNFFENWNPSNYTGKIYQVIENIPNGLYELAICAFVNSFDATAQYVYANTDKRALVTGVPTAYTVRTTVTDNTIEVGFEQTAAVANWIGIDNVSLNYLGEPEDDDTGEVTDDSITVASPWVGSAVENGKTYYLYNVKASAFLTGANSWGTQASLGQDGLPFVAEGADGVYALSSVVANSATNHYLGTIGYIDAAPAYLTLTEVSEGVYTIGWDNNYYASTEGTSVVQTVTTLSDACYWQFLTREDIQSQMVAASIDNPYSVTSLIACANFGHYNTDISAWTGNPTHGGDYPNQCAEKWSAGIVEVAQVLRNMPSGLYRLRAQGFYRMGDINTAVSARNSNTEILHAKFFANGDSAAVMSVMEEAGKLSGVGDYYSNYGMAPNSLSDASQFFDAGLYEHSFVFVLDENVDTIKLGVAKTDSVASDWLAFDNYRLEYLGTEVVNPQITYMVDGEVYLTENIVFGKSIALPEPPTKEGYVFIGWQGLPETMPNHDVTVTGVFAIDDSSSEDISDSSWHDVTANYLKNADLASTVNWVVNDVSNGYEASFIHNGTNRVAEFYAGWENLNNTYGSLMQTVTLPAGDYRLSGKAFYRAGIAFDSNLGKSLGYLVAGDNKALVKTLSSVVNLDSYANTIDEAATAFYTDSLYTNILKFTLTETTTLNIGYECTHDEPFSWFCFGEMTLEKRKSTTTEVPNDSITVASPWVGSTVENGKTYYLYNVKASAFLTGANSWGTQASLGQDGLPFVAEGADGVYALSSVVANSATNHYLGTDLYVDQAKKGFVFAEVGNGIYTIARDNTYVAYIDGNIVTTAKVNDGCYWQLLTAESIKEQMGKANATNPYSVTSLIACANFGRNNTDISAWTGSPICGGENANYCAEKWYAGISVVSQTLSGLPNGTYKLQAQGFYRMGNIDAAVALRDAGTEVYNVKFFANTDSVQVMSVMDEAGKLDGIGTAYGTYGTAPNSLDHASEFFSADFYEHEFYFTVTDGTATIGIANNTGVSGDWLVFDNFRLTYYGTAAIDDEDTVLADTFPKTSTADSPKYYTIASYSRGGYLTGTGMGEAVQHVDITSGSYWYLTVAEEGEGVYFCNAAGGYLASNLRISDTPGVWHVLPNGVNESGLVISSTNPISSGSCIDANTLSSTIGMWMPSATDWEGTTWVFAAADSIAIDDFEGNNEVYYFGDGVIDSIPEGNHYVYYTDESGEYHFLHAAGVNNWMVSDTPQLISFSDGNTSDGAFADAASFMVSNGYYMSNPQNRDGTGAIRTEEINGINGTEKRVWESQVFYKNVEGKYAIRLTNATGTDWGANCFLNIDPTTLEVIAGQAELGNSLYVWEIAEEDDSRFPMEPEDTVEGPRSLPITFTTEDGLPGVLNGENRYVWESPLFRLESSHRVLRFTVNETSGGGVDANSYPCFAWAEFFMKDSLGNNIEITEDMITTNACHNTLNSYSDGNGIAGMLDGDHSTYFHSTWIAGADGYHYIQVALPNGGYDSFSFGFISRHERITPTSIVVTSMDSISEVKSYQITYMVDGEVYFTEDIAVGEKIIQPTPPTKQGYTFCGWIDIPETMPNHDVTVTGEFVIDTPETVTDSQGLVYNLNENSDAYVVANVTKTIGSDIVIPAELYGLPVTSIEEKTFMGVEELRSIVIPTSVTAVGNRVFYGCSNLLLVEWNTLTPLRSNCFDEPSRHGNMLVFVGNDTTEVTYKGNVVINDRAESITLTSGKPFRNPNVFTAANISFTQDFAKKTKIGEAGGWEALVLPFDVQTIVSEKKGTLLPFGQADFSTSLPYWAAEMQADGTFTSVDDIKANTPFIMEVPNSDEYEDIYNVEGTVTFSATDVMVHATTESLQPSANGYSLQASYEGVDAASGVYALNDEEYVTDGNTFLPGGVFVADSRDIRPFEAYVYSDDASRAPYLRIGGKESTGITSIVVGMNDNAWYTLQGIRLSGKPQEQGVYIYNGRKVIVR